MEKACRTISVSCGNSFSIVIMLDIMFCLSICKNLLYFLAIKLLNFIHYENSIRYYRAVDSKDLKGFIIFLHHYNNILELYFYVLWWLYALFSCSSCNRRCSWRKMIALYIAYTLFLFPLELWFQMWTGGTQIVLVIYIMS